MQTIVARNAYRWGIVVAAVVTMAVTESPSAWPGPGWPMLVAAGWAAAVGLAALSPGVLPWKGIPFTFTPALELAVLLLFGPAPAIALVGVGRWAGDVMRRRPFADAFVTASEAVVVIGVTGFALTAAGSGRAFAGPPHAAAIAWTLIAYAATRAAIVLLRGALIDGEPVAHHFRPRRLPLTVAHDLAVLPLGLVLQLLPAPLGVLVAGYALLPLAIVRGTTEHRSPTSGSLLSTIRALMFTIDAFDPFTRGHSERISRWSVLIARRLGVSGRECEDIECGALLHDIGRTAIHLDILHIDRQLNAGERAVMQTHPTVGFEILKAIPDLDRAAEIVYAHHERPDGRGYPRALSAGEIPVGSRIIMAVAAFDAMIRDRPYRRGLTPQEACEELQRHSGTQFFPEVVDALIQLHRDGGLSDSHHGPTGASEPAHEHRPAA